MRCPRDREARRCQSALLGAFLFLWLRHQRAPSTRAGKGRRRTRASRARSVNLADAYPTADPNPDASAPAPSSTRRSVGHLHVHRQDARVRLARRARDVGRPLARRAHARARRATTRRRARCSSSRTTASPRRVTSKSVQSRMDTSSDARGYIVAYPEGIATSWNAGDCCGDSWTDSVDDVQFTRDLLGAIEADYCIDPKRVFATGFSNGGFLSHRLGCEMSDVFAAIAPVAGVLGDVRRRSCKPKRAIPVLDFHGTADPVVPYNGGTPFINIGMGIVVPIRARHARVLGERRTGASRRRSRSSRTATRRAPSGRLCKGGANVVHCKIDQGGHQWPGGVALPIVGKCSHRHQRDRHDDRLLRGSPAALIRNRALPREAQEKAAARQWEEVHVADRVRDVRAAEELLRVARDAHVEEVAHVERDANAAEHVEPQSRPTEARAAAPRSFQRCRSSCRRVRRCRIECEAGRAVGDVDDEVVRGASGQRRVALAKRTCSRCGDPCRMHAISSAEESRATSSASTPRSVTAADVLGLRDVAAPMNAKAMRSLRPARSRRARLDAQLAEAVLHARAGVDGPRGLGEQIGRGDEAARRAEALDEIRGA